MVVEELDSINIGFKNYEYGAMKKGGLATRTKKRRKK